MMPLAQPSRRSESGANTCFDDYQIRLGERVRRSGYVEHRNYAASFLGRFISRDPIGHAGNLNLYAYPTNPVSRVDATGLIPGGPSSQPGGNPDTFSTREQSLILRAINEISRLGYGDDANRLTQLYNQGMIDPITFGPSARNNPFTGGIDLKHDSCQSFNDRDDLSERDKNLLSHLYLTALLYHEARHHRTQSDAFKLMTGVAGHIMGQPDQWLNLEKQAYLDEAAFLDNMASRLPRGSMGQNYASSLAAHRRRQVKEKEGVRDSLKACKFHD
jgi:RHS repeat-associated protein